MDTALCFQALRPRQIFLSTPTSFFWDFGDGTTSTARESWYTCLSRTGHLYHHTWCVLNSNLGLQRYHESATLYCILLPVVTAQGDTVCEGRCTASTYRLLTYCHRLQTICGRGQSVADPTATALPQQPRLLDCTTMRLLVTDTNSCTSSDIATVVVINPLVHSPISIPL
jgi:hypothetical protein